MVEKICPKANSSVRPKKLSDRLILLILISLMGSPEEAPPCKDGHLHFDRDWEKRRWGAIALSKQGHHEWEELRQTLITAISECF